MADSDLRRLPRWWFGGICSAVAVTATHPLDLVKVQLQTQLEKTEVKQLIAHVYKKAGIIGFYSGISASWFRQLTYTTSRFAIYEYGGIVGVPGDVVTVRLQNDIKLPEDKRRNYKHVFDGLYRISKEEGIRSLFRGTVPAVTRAVLLTIVRVCRFIFLRRQ
ncbi:hypothetical protein ACLKA6_013701 [Drosophila palustris]